MRYREDAGRSMVEVIGYISVLMVITASIGKMVTNAYSDYKMSKATLQVTELAGAISKAGAIDVNYDEVVNMINGDASLSDVKKAEGLKFIPTSFRHNGHKIYHAFGGVVEVSASNNKFSFTFTKLERNQCIELAVKDWSKDRFADLYSIQINTHDTLYWPVYSGSSDNALPVTRAIAAGVTDNGLCDQASNSITWTFN